MSPISEREQPTATEHAREPDEQRIVSMTPDGKTSAYITAVLRRRIDDIAQAIRDKDVQRLLAFYAADVTAFDLRPPLDVRSANAYRSNFEEWFASIEGPLDFELHNLRIVPGE